MQTLFKLQLDERLHFFDEEKKTIKRGSRYYLNGTALSGVS